MIIMVTPQRRERKLKASKTGKRCCEMDEIIKHIKAG
jgi:hypothetical protein